MSLPDELKAYLALTELLERAKEVRGMFEVANLPIPAPLQRLEGMETRKKSSGIPKPIPPVSVPGYEPSWIWVPIEAMQVRGMILAVLAEAGGPMGWSEVISRIEVYREVKNRVSVLNAGLTLERDGLIERTDEGWTLRSGASVPRLGGGYALGPQEGFGKHEIAAHRREAIKYLLAQPYNRGGAQIMQLVRQLESADWVIAPKTKDIVKEDIALMKRNGEIRQLGNTRKYELVAE